MAGAPPSLIRQVVITADLWFDDVEDLPLTYAFAYAERQGGGTSTPLGERSGEKVPVLY